MKHIVFLFILILSIGCQVNENKQSTFKYIIAPEAALVVKFEDYSEWQESLNKQSFIAKNKSNLLLEFWTLENFENIIDIPDEAVLSFSTLGNNKLIKTLSFEAKPGFKLKIESKQFYNYDNVVINSFVSGEDEVFYTHLDGKAIFCTSKIIIENIIRNFRGEIKNPQAITRFLDVLSDQSPSLVIHNKSFSKISNQFFEEQILTRQMSLSEYSGYDLNIDNDKVLLSGIIFNSTEDKKFWTGFKNVNAQKSTAVQVIPSNFKNATSVLFSNYEKLISPSENVIDKSETDSLFVNLKEISNIELNKGVATILTSKNIDQTFSYLNQRSKIENTFSDNKIYELNEPFSIGDQFNTIINPINAKYYAVYMDHIICSDKLETIEDLIIQINNKNTIGNQANYNNHLESLNSECHIQWLVNLENQTEFFDNYGKEKYKTEFKSIDWENHELLMSQLIVEDEFAYFNILQKKTIKNQNNTKLNQIIRLKSDNSIINTPLFFENWRTGQQDVVYQDDQYILYLKDTKGNLIWTKKINSPILGEISSIDIYQNKRIQMAFATKDKIYIVDKNGNDVGPFPIKLKDDITKGLSVFDYNNDGQYRFTVVLNNRIEMFDKSGKRVRGFNFNDAKTAISYPIKHIRMVNKDYIVAQEETGKLHILNRRGQTRIELNKNLKFSDHEWFEHDKHFTSVNNKGEILKINSQGKLNKLVRDLINPKFTANEKDLVILSENKLYINSKEKELPYGLYTNPILKKNYVGISDKQARKIYILNDNAEIVKGFPVFGEELIDFYSNEKEVVVLCRDGNNSIIVYQAEFR